MTSPPPGFEDMLGDAEEAVAPSGPYRPIEVDGVGTVRARKPMPNAVPNLAMSAGGHLDNTGRADHLTRFVRNHLEYGEGDRILAGMITGDMPEDAYARVATAIATWGTARPT